MVEQVMENAREVVHAQQEMLRHWTSCLTGMQAAPQDPAFRRRWAEACTQLLKRQRERMEGQFNAVLRTVDAACRVAEARAPEQFLATVLQFWERAFDAAGQLAEANLREFQAAVAQWAEPESPGEGGRAGKERQGGGR